MSFIIAVYHVFFIFSKKLIYELAKIENLLQHRIHCYSGKIQLEDFYNNLKV